MGGEGLDDDADVGVILLHAEDGGAAHAVQRLEDHVLVLGVEGAQLVGAAGHQRGRGVFGKPGGVELLVGVAQALGLVDDEATLVLGPLQHVGGVDKFGVEGGILAHQDHVQAGERLIHHLAEAIPVGIVIFDGERTHGAEGATGLHVEILHLQIEQLVAALLRLFEHGEAGVLLDVDGRDGVHHDAEFNGHPLFLL